MMRGLLVGLLLCPAALFAVENGDSKHQVLSELGPPRSTIGIGDREILTYGAGKVVLIAGQVSAIEGELSVSAPTTRAPPAPSPRSYPSANAPPLPAVASRPADVETDHA